MKPSKNLVFCVNAGRQKQRYETKAEADRFIKYNGDDVPNHRQPLRSYYCDCCCAWHISKSYRKKIYDATSSLPIEEVRVAGKQYAKQMRELHRIENGVKHLRRKMERLQRSGDCLPD